MPDWPFDDVPNTAVFTTRAVARQGAPIVLVVHDEEAWQFLDAAADGNVENGLLVALANVVRLDPSVAELADLPYAWKAMRVGVGEPWTRMPLD